MPISDCQIIQLPKIEDVRGSLTFLEGGDHIPFEMKRAYYLYDVPGGSVRGSHAHKELHQFFVAMSGSFDVVLHDGESEQRFHLNRSYYGLYVCPMIWRTLDNFSSGAVCLVFASERFSEEDYIRDQREFFEVARGSGSHIDNGL